MEDCLVAIIILNWNGYSYTRNCLHSLSRTTSKDFKIILVDNASSDGSLNQLKEEFEEVIYLQNEENLGFTGGNNVGIQYALDRGFEYIMLLNNDTEVKEDFMEPLINALNINDGLGAVQPLMYYLHEKTTIWNAGGKYNPWTGSSKSIKQIKKVNDQYATDWITGCCILIRSRVIEEIGLLNDHYFAYFEDVDWSLRMKSKGHSLSVVPQSVIYHEAGASLKAKNMRKEGVLNPKVHYLNTRNQIFQLRNHLGFPFFLYAWPFQFMKFGMYGIYFLLRRRKNKFLALLNGIKDGVFQDCK
ncbi:glycosyltransferase family 2 protein [Echinicola sp. CAU 1574]|uniref:Glycosyltransferase family 2 protein n=1 Tax=Echinicola arenosa TaxID=2774144 RepID=A0ABR9AIS3_9BACT|nr:glycosyltransferase family 2 protein [Echinicola arenosa]MBD8488662.1 glycosyltransferase family 2 protein [Echinicola arenosa]